MEIEQIITQLEISHWMDGCYSKNLLANARPHLTQVNKALETRGLPIIPIENKRAVAKTDEFPPMFVAAVNLVADYADKRTIGAKLKSISCTTRQWQAWLRVKRNKDYFEKIINERFNNIESVARLSLMRNVESGSLPDIKYVHEYTGRYRPNQELTMNLGIILGRMMEILSKHVDPKVLAEVANELDSVLELESGEEVNA